MKLCALTAFYVALSIPTAEMLTVSVPGEAVMVRLGHEATLPCWLNPTMNAEGLEVRWYRVKFFDNPVLFYRGRQIQQGTIQAEYVGRTSLGLREARSEGLKEGDVTLKLANVTLNDGGEYVCYVSSDKGYDNANIQVNVTVMGTPPLMSMVRTAPDSVNVSCESRGWHPSPRLQWSDGKRSLAPQGLAYSSDGQGLVAVRSWLVSNSPWVSCSLSLSAEEEMAGRVDLDKLAALPEDQSGWKTAFILVLLITLIIVATLMVLYLKKNGKKGTHNKEMEVESKSCAVLDDVKKHAVDVTLDNSRKNGFLTVTPNGKVVRDKNITMTEEDWFTKPTFILGTTGFTSGCAYWEVGLGDESKQEVGVKESWWVGLASESVKPQADVGLESPPFLEGSSSNGFWYLSSEKGKGFRVNTAPTILFSVASRPQTLGVYLDYAKGQVSFYNVKDQIHIVTLHTTTFTGKVFPLFNPGIGDKAPMTILDIKLVCENRPNESDLLLE